MKVFVQGSRDYMIVLFRNKNFISQESPILADVENIIFGQRVADDLWLTFFRWLVV